MNSLKNIHVHGVDMETIGTIIINSSSKMLNSLLCCSYLEGVIDLHCIFQALEIAKLESYWKRFQNLEICSHYYQKWGKVSLSHLYIVLDQNTYTVHVVVDLGDICEKFSGHYLHVNLRTGGRENVSGTPPSKQVWICHCAHCTCVVYLH